MATKYLISCECGEKIEIELYQAGQVVTCSNGHSCDVPSMRGIRELPRSESTALDDHSSPVKWSRSQGSLFALGVIVLLVSFIVLVYVGRPIFMLDPTPTSFEQLNLAESMEIWEYFSENSLDRQASPIYVNNMLAIAEAKKHVFYSLLGSLFGITSISISFILRSRRPRKKC